MINIQNTILGKIVDRKHEELAARLKQRNLQDVEELAKVATPVRGFAKALQHKRPGVIAEIKKAGINSTGWKDENQLPELLKAFAEYRTTNNLWEVVK